MVLVASTMILKTANMENGETVGDNRTIEFICKIVEESVFRRLIATSITATRLRFPYQFNAEHSHFLRLTMRWMPLTSIMDNSGWSSRSRMPMKEVDEQMTNILKKDSS